MLELDQGGACSCEQGVGRSRDPRLYWRQEAVYRRFGAGSLRFQDVRSCPIIRSLLTFSRFLLCFHPPPPSATGLARIDVDTIILLLSVSYAQGFMLMREAAAEYKWNLNYAGIALMWRGGELDLASHYPNTHVTALADFLHCLVVANDRMHHQEVRRLFPFQLSFPFLPPSFRSPVLHELTT